MSSDIMSIPSYRLYSTTVKLVEKKPEGEPYRYGTGFFFNFSKPGEPPKLCIVTARHVLEGIESAVIRFSTTKGGSRRADKVTLANVQDSIVWHPDPVVDLCAVPLAGLPEAMLSHDGSMLDHAAIGPQDLPSDADVSCMSPVEEVYMVGYPLGYQDEASNLPLARKGITASPYVYDYNRQTDFMLDIACFHGSSGSPVFLYKEEIRLMDDGETAEHVATKVKLLGVTKENRVEPNAALVDGMAVPNLVVTDPINLALCVKSWRILELEPGMPGGK